MSKPTPSLEKEQYGTIYSIFYTIDCIVWALSFEVTIQSTVSSVELLLISFHGLTSEYPGIFSSHLFICLFN
jgi:hypothetical protein